jgi:PAS domain S-box-containing protein
MSELQDSTSQSPDRPGRGPKPTYQELLERVAQLEDMLERRKEQFASFPERNPNPVAEVDVRGQVLYLNPVAEQLFPDVRDRGPEHPWLSDWEAAVRTMREGPSRTYERVVVVGDRHYGQTLHFLADVGSIRVYSADITERVRAEQALQRSEALLRAVIDATPDAVYAKDAGSRVVLLNPAALKVVGKPAEQILGHDDRDFYDDPAVADAVIENDKRVMSTGVAERCAETLLTPEGYRIFLDTKAPWRDADGRIIGIVGVSRDISEQKRAESVLQATLQRFYTVLSSMYSAILLVTNDRRVEFANPAFCHVFDLEDAPSQLVGLGPAELVDKIKSAYLHPDDAIARIHEIRDRGQPVKNEEVAMRNGKTYLRQFVPLNVDGKPCGWVWSYIDITERQQVEEALRASSAILNGILDSSVSGIMAFKSVRDSTGRIVDFEWQLCNRTAERIVGRRAVDLVGRRLLVEMPGNREEGLFDKYVVVVETGNLLHHEHYYEHEGLKHWFETCAVKLGDGFAVTFFDITARKWVEEELRANELRYRRLFESMNEAFYLARMEYDATGKVVDFTYLEANSAFERLMGVAPGQLVGKTAKAVVPTIASHWVKVLAEVAQTGAPAHYEEYSDVFQKHFELIVFSPVRGQCAVLVTDVTDRRRTQEELREANTRLMEADRRKNEFLAVLSHELRNPLAPIRNSAYVLEHAAPGGEQAKRALAVIDRQAGQLTRLVDDLLDVTRITRNKIQLQCQIVDLNEVVRHATEDQRSLFDKSEVKLVLSPAPGPLWVNADSHRLAQVIGNLLQNAAKFTGRGGQARITIRADALANRGVVEVADTGIGMAPEMVSRLFQPFSQAESTLDRSKGGLGLGLALAKGLVELHGGDITAKSSGLDHGAEFVVRLPLAKENYPAQQPGERATTRRRRVLIIEDNIDAADSLRDLLAFGKHVVDVAYNGPQGISKARDFHPDVVLCDLGLPGMDGFEVARALRADGVLKGTCLVALSGYALPEDLQRASETGFAWHLAKPPSLDRLEEILAQVP